MHIGLTCPPGMLPVYSVGGMDEAKMIRTLACELGYGGEYVAPELVAEQSLENLDQFGERPMPSPADGDTTKLEVVDAEGNMVSSTPSGGWLRSSPVVKGLGMPLGTRAQMFYLNRERPNALEPRKRPRTTLTPSLVTKDGGPWMVFGTQGGDTQDQITLQFFLNCVDFGMSVQEALEAPTVCSSHFPGSFYPRSAFPARVTAEGRLPADVVAELERRGHEVNVKGDWAHGKALAIRIDRERGVIHAGASPRHQIGYAIAW